jgi:hypothetical protein
MHFDLNTIDAYGSFLGGLASVISLIGILFAVTEVRRAGRIVDRETDHRIYQMMLDIDRFFIENPDLRCYIYDGATMSEEYEEGSPEYHRVMATIELMVDFMECAYSQFELMPIHQRIGWIHYFIAVSHSSPLLRQYVQEESDSYMPAFVRLIATGKYDPRLDKADIRAEWQQLNQASLRNRWQAWRHKRFPPRSIADARREALDTVTSTGVEQ